MNIKPNRSDNYVCTISLNDENDIKELKAIKASVKTLNKIASIYHYRVKLAGRKPREKMLVISIWNRDSKSSIRSYNNGGNWKYSWWIKKCN